MNVLALMENRTVSESAQLALDRPYLAAELPSGHLLVPGVSEPAAGVETCAGPDAWGRCPAVARGRVPMCQDATWYRCDRSGARSWQITFRPDAEMLAAGLCPVEVLEPMGGLVLAARAVLAAAP